MNITSTTRPNYAPRYIEPKQQPDSSAADKFTFASGVAQGGEFTAGIAGPIAGIRWGFKAGMELSIAAGRYEVGIPSLIGAAVGGFAGYQAGKLGPGLVGNLGERLGLSSDVASAVGAAAVGTALGGAAAGGLWGAGAGAAIALGTGAVQHFRG